MNENRRVAFEEHLTVAKQKKSLWETAIKTGARFFKPQAVAFVLSATVFFANSIIANPFSFASDTQKNTDSKVDVNRITELLTWGCRYKKQGETLLLLLFPPPFHMMALHNQTQDIFPRDNTKDP